MKGVRGQSGFTLIEIVVALTITAILVGLAAMMMTTPMNAYLNQANNAVLLDAGERVSQRMAADLRRALPNSVSIRNAGTQSIVEMLIVESVGFYRNTGELADLDRELDFSAPDTKLALFGRIDPAAVAPYLINGRHLVVSNGGRGVAGRDAYQPGGASGASTPDGTTISVMPDSSSGVDALTIAPAFRFRDPGAGSSQRAFVVSGPVAYLCDSAAGTRSLRRYGNYAISPNIPTGGAAPQLNAAGVSVEILSTDVDACRMRCRGGAASADVCQDTLVVQIGLSRSSVDGGAARIRLHQQFPLDNRP